MAAKTETGVAKGFSESGRGRGRGLGLGVGVGLGRHVEVCWPGWISLAEAGPEAGFRSVGATRGDTRGEGMITRGEPNAGLAPFAEP